jgi:hypothetical protein
VKCALALHYRVVPPTINVEQVNPAFNVEQSPFRVNTGLAQWPRTRFPRRAVCSSMGFGGTNFHVILEERPATARQPQGTRPHIDIGNITPAPPAQPFTFIHPPVTTPEREPLPTGPVSATTQRDNPTGGEAPMTQRDSTSSDMEQYILSINDPVLSHMLYSPEFRAFVNREQAGIRMVVRQTVLEMFNARTTGNRTAPPVKLPPVAEAAPEPTPAAAEPEPYDIGAMRMSLDPAPETPNRLEEAPRAPAVTESRRVIPDEPEKDSDDVRAVLLGIVKDKTGYTEDMIAGDAEFESELRIDSIKQTEILGMLAEHFGIPPDRMAEMDLERITLNSIVGSAEELLSRAQ